MVGFPKVLKTKADIVNTFKLVQKGKLKAKDWLAAIEKLENTNYIFCPILEMTEDRKTVTIMYCSEISEGDKVKAGNLTATANAVEHTEVDTDSADDTDSTDATEDTETAAESTSASNTVTHTIITLSRAIAADTETIGVPAAVTFYDRMGITEDEVDEMKGELE